MKVFLFLIHGLLFNQAILCQQIPEAGIITDSTIISIDTVESKGSNYTLTHYHKVSRVNGDKMLFDKKDDIFTDSLNNHSRLIFDYRNNGIHSFDIPTVPLTNIIFLEGAELIVGLSDIVISPYSLVIYSIDGKLLYKATLSAFELKVSKEELRTLLKTNPGLRDCLSQMTIVKEKDHYYLELSRCMINTLGRDSISKMKTFRSSHYFPFMSQPASCWGYSYTQHYNFFANSDPLYDLITIGSVPYLLILNAEDGKKVNIPLLSNCDIFKEIKEK